MKGGSLSKRRDLNYCPRKPNCRGCQFPKCCDTCPKKLKCSQFNEFKQFIFKKIQQAIDFSSPKDL